MKKLVIFSIILFCFKISSFGQKIIRSSLSSFGNAVSEDGVVYRQTIGQSSSTSVVFNERSVLRQGFQQPVFTAVADRVKIKECTLILNPNPASNNVTISFSEQIGENQLSVFDIMGKLYLKRKSVSEYYEMDVSWLPRGVYVVNVISNSGYQCNQKLIVL